MATPLADLDELVLRCRDERARALISEAVSGYRAGAFRSAIVATWIAVSFDLIEKLRELALAGDSSAEKLVEKLERIRAQDDLAGALAFERGLIKLARDDFEFISPIEYIDLERLQADRNRCAHPSLVNETSPYRPSAELVRAHIFAAVDHVLKHPPAQGKFALERLLAQIDSEYFPTRRKDAITALSVGPLKKARESLVRNLVIILVKQILKKDGSARARRTSALFAIKQLHGVTFEKTLRAKLSQIVRPAQDDVLDKVLMAISAMPDAWQYLEADVSQRLKNYVSALPSAAVDHLEWLLAYEPVKAEAKSRAKRATRAELKLAFFFSLPAALVDRYIELYLQSESYEQANETAKELIGYKEDFSREQVIYLISKANKNGEVTGSFRFPDLIAALREVDVISNDDFDAALVAADLEVHVPEEGEGVPF